MAAPPPRARMVTATAPRISFFPSISRPSVVGFGDLACYRESKAESGRRAGRVCPMETLEYERQLVLGDPDSRVRDLQLGPAVRLPDRHRHLAPFGGVFDRVVQEDRCRLPDAAPVEGGIDRLLRGEVPDGYLLTRGGLGRPCSLL